MPLAVLVRVRRSARSASSRASARSARSRSAWLSAYAAASPAFSYHPDKLSVERIEDSAFGPGDRIGQLTLRNLDIADSRAKLEQYAGLGMLGGPHPELTGTD